MLKFRLIPVLLLQNGLLVRSERFSVHQIIGNPIDEVRRFNEWTVDELIYIDITQDDVYDTRRSDHKIKDFNDPLRILDEVSKTCFMPLTWGGRIRTLEDIHLRISRGADKISINTQAMRTPALISEAAKTFGSQAVVVCMDVLKHPSGAWEVFINGSREPTGWTPTNWAKEIESRGGGEILLQSIDRDGTGLGYDVELIQAVSSVTQIPIIALGGVGTYEHYVKGIKAGASAVAAANIWHFKELADRNAKRVLVKAGVDVRV